MAGRKAIVSAAEKAPQKAAKAAATALAPEVAVGLEIAGKAAEAAGKALTADIVVVKTLRNIGTKKNPVWQEKEVHYNVVAAGAGILVLGVAGFVAASAWEGRAGGAFFGPSPRLKDNYSRFLDAHPKVQARLKLNKPG